MARKPHDPTFTIDASISSSKGLTLNPQGKTITNPRLIEDQDIFSYNKYATKIHMPYPIHQIDVTPLESLWARCLDMPIRLAGQTEYKLPEEWAGLAPLISNIIAQEHTTNPNWVNYNTYITVDCSKVTPSQQQRHGGLHVDGFQGSRIDPKTKITRNYVMTTNGGTRFYPQRFIVADENEFNVFQGFDIQAERFETAEENMVYFMDAYTVHESGFAERKGIRAFLRVSYDLKKFDRAGNTHNSMLDYEWDMVARNVHETVKTPNYPDLENSPHYPTIPLIHKTNKPKLIGISGKPGSAKNYFSFKLIQEFRHLGYSIEKVSIPTGLYVEANHIVNQIKAGMLPTTIAFENNLTTDQAATLFELASGDLGVRNPEWGYNRRNENFRKILDELGTNIRRAQDPNYFLNQILETPTKADFLIFTDMRFPNEADHVNLTGGITLRAEVNEHWTSQTKTATDGYKYTTEGINNPSETALDDYLNFFQHVTVGYTRPIILAHNLLRHFGYQTGTPETFEVSPQ